MITPSFGNGSEFSDKLYTSYLWNVSTEDMLETVLTLMAQAQEYGIDLDYSKFGLIAE